MAVVWDERKAARNLKKHEVPFDEAAAVFSDPLFVIAKDEDHSMEEKRFIILGESNAGRLLVVAYAERGKDTRIISAREATPRERKNYEKEI
ncbi:MAG TPA: BrnT family toxin [Pyrinomonadaceae bacterium]|nr:BrnT family toxin [Pyrinomonadaceae bacterium]